MMMMVSNIRVMMVMMMSMIFFKTVLLDLSNCRSLSDRSIVAIAQSCYDLINISLYGCFKLTGANMFVITITISIIIIII
jgi:hypothetical protein